MSSVEFKWLRLLWILLLALALLLVPEWTQVPL